MSQNCLCRSRILNIVFTSVSDNQDDLIKRFTKFEGRFRYRVISAGTAKYQPGFR